MRVFKVKVNGNSYDVEVDEVGGQSVAVNTATVSAPQPAPATVAPVAAAAVGGTQLKSPLPGLILGFKVENGAKVKKGQVVLELEAMKMANDIPSPADGVITFTTTKGATVNTGDIIATIN